MQNRVASRTAYELNCEGRVEDAIYEVDCIQSLRNIGRINQAEFLNGEPGITIVRSHGVDIHTRATEYAGVLVKNVIQYRTHFFPSPSATTIPVVLDVVLNRNFNILLNVGNINLNSIVVNSYAAQHGVGLTLLEGVGVLPVVAEGHGVTVEDTVDIHGLVVGSREGRIQHGYVAEHHDFVDVSHRRSSFSIGDARSLTGSYHEVSKLGCGSQFGQTIEQLSLTGDTLYAVTGYEVSILVGVNQSSSGSILNVDVRTLSKYYGYLTQCHVGSLGNSVHLSAGVGSGYILGEVSTVRTNDDVVNGIHENDIEVSELSSCTIVEDEVFGLTFIVAGDDDLLESDFTGP